MININDLNKMKQESMANGLHIGYSEGDLTCGYSFFPSANKLQKKLKKLAERIKGIKKQREACEIISRIGYTVFENYEVPSLRFGVKWSAPRGLTNPEQILEPYTEILAECLNRAGWQDIKKIGPWDFRVPLTNPHNLQNLIKISDSIGFHYKSKKPDLSDLENIRIKMILANHENQK